MKDRLPFLISVPHGGTEAPESVRERLLLTDEELRYYSDPLTHVLFGYRDRVEAYIDTPISRMIVDLNRPPLPLPLHDPDGIIKTRTIDGGDVYRYGQVPDMHLIHHLLIFHYFPYHQQIDELLDQCQVRIAFDCHSMLPSGSVNQRDAGKVRPLICLGNNGDQRGKERKGTIATCSEEWIRELARIFREVFPKENAVAINNPFSGGFISNAHYWHKGIPWIQIEINRALYESDTYFYRPDSDIPDQVIRVREKIWDVLRVFWDRIRD